MSSDTLSLTRRHDGLTFSSLRFSPGMIKPSVAPLLADQSPVHRQEIKTLPTGEVVIVDPGTSNSSLSSPELESLADLFLASFSCQE